MVPWVREVVPKRPNRLTALVGLDQARVAQAGNAVFDHQPCLGLQLLLRGNEKRTTNTEDSREVQAVSGGGAHVEVRRPLKRDDRHANRYGDENRGTDY